MMGESVLVWRVVGGVCWCGPRELDLGFGFCVIFRDYKSPLTACTTSDKDENAFEFFAARHREHVLG